jgi:hypothetical protein
LPAVKTAAPTRVANPTRPMSALAVASSMSSNDTEPMSMPVPRAMTTAINARDGVVR